MRLAPAGSDTHSSSVQAEILKTLRTFYRDSQGTKPKLAHKTDDLSANSSIGPPQHGSADRSSIPCSAAAANHEPSSKRAKTGGNNDDAGPITQAMEESFAADFQSLARTPAFYQLLGLDKPPEHIGHPSLKDFAKRDVHLKDFPKSKEHL